VKRLPKYQIGGSLISLIRNHPELVEDDDLKNLGMSNFELKRTMEKLSSEKQAAIRNQVLTYLTTNLKYPSPLQKEMGKEDYPYQFMQVYREMLEQTHLFNPIPESLVRQMGQLAEDLSSWPISKEFGEGKTKKSPIPGNDHEPGYVEESIVSDIAQAISLTNTDSPSAVEFIRRYLTRRGKAGFDFPGQRGYNTWFGAVGGLGSQGKEFVPQLKKELQYYTSQLPEAEKELAEIEKKLKAPTGSHEAPKQNLYVRRHKLEDTIRDIKRAEEEYRWAIDAIESGQRRSTKYNPF